MGLIDPDALKNYLSEDISYHGIYVTLGKNLTDKLSYYTYFLVLLYTLPVELLLFFSPNIPISSIELTYTL